MTDRRAVAIPGLAHATAIPVASRIGPLLVSSVIAAFDPGTRDVPATIEAQIRNLFDHVGAILDVEGAGWDTIAKMNFWLADPSHRSALEAPWVEHFPDPRSRPARHTHIDPQATMASCDLLAYVAP
ncbi:MAG: RidA family protein [Desertimonas sp.]